jgi:hypothetical protein
MFPAARLRRRAAREVDSAFVEGQAPLHGNVDPVDLESAKKEL